MESILSFLLVSLALVGSPGPNTVSLAALGAAFGYRRGLAYMAGINLGMIGVIALVSSGISALLLALPGVLPTVAIAATLYLLYLAYRIATAPVLSMRNGGNAKPPSWHAGAFLSLTNPKAYAAVTAVFTQRQLMPDPGLTDLISKAGLLFAVIMTANTLWLLIGAAITNMLQDETAGRLVNIAFAAALLLSVGLAFLL